MKKLLFFIVAAMFAVSCSEDGGDVTGVDSPFRTGIVSFNITPLLVVDGTRAQVNLPEGTVVPAGDDFALAIVGVDSDYQNEWASVAAFNENYKKTYFKEGSYNATITYGDPSQEGENKPYFEATLGYNVVARQHKKLDMQAALANSIVKVEFTETFKSYFENGAAIEILSGNGNEWVVDYTTSPYIFVESGKDLTISGSAIKQRPSANVEPETVNFLEVVKTMEACKMYLYKFDVSTAGCVSVNVTITNEPTEEVIVHDGFETNDDAIWDEPEQE